MILLWVIAALLSAGAASLVILGAARAFDHVSDPDPTLGVYQRQLSEIDDLASRNLIAEGERKQAHAEAARRLLAAAEAKDQDWSATDRSPRAVFILAVLAPVLALALYLGLGSPGIPDQPFQARLAAWRASDPAHLEPPQLAALLKDMTRQRPRDPQAFLYLALAQREAGNPTESVRAARHAVALSPDDAALWEVLGESLMMEAKGDVSDAARQAFGEALKRDPKAVSSRYYLARAEIERGDRARGIAGLQALSAELPKADPRQKQLGLAIAEARAGPAKVENAQLDMIRGMVAGLAARLEQSPDDPEGWVRLVRSYAVLGQTADRDRALTQAKARYAAKPDILADLEAAARTERLK